MKRGKRHYSVAEANGILEFCVELDKLIGRVKARNPTTDLRPYFIALKQFSAAMREAVERDKIFTILVGVQSEFDDFATADQLYAEIE